MTCECAAEMARLLTSIDNTLGYIFIALCVSIGLSLAMAFR